MAVWSEVSYKKSVAEGRLDAEYFMPFLLELEQKLKAKNAVPLGTLGEVFCSAFYPAATELYEYGDTPFIRCVDIINYPVLTPEQEYAKIPSDFIKENKSIRSVKGGDIVISKVGSPCYAGLLHESMPESAMTRTVLGVRNIRTDLVDPRYLVIFLRASVGFDQLMRERELTIQYQLTLDRTRKVKIFLPPMRPQREIGDLLTKYIETEQAFRRYYARAEELLLEELGLKNLDLSPTLYYERTLSESQQASRLDAEFFQPKYDMILSSIRKHRHKMLKEVAKLKKGKQAKSSDEFNGPLYASIKDISSFLIEPSEKAMPSERLVMLKQGGIVLAITGATIGKTGINATGEQIAICGDFLAIENTDLPPEYLQVVIDSTLIENLCHKYTTGATNGHLSPSDVGEFPIPILRSGAIDQIVSKVKTAISARKESLCLLEEANRIVGEVIME